MFVSNPRTHLITLSQTSFSLLSFYLQVTQLELHRHFYSLGAGVVEEVRLQRDIGFGFVRYNNHAEAALAIQIKWVIPNQFFTANRLRCVCFPLPSASNKLLSVQ